MYFNIPIACLAFMYLKKVMKLSIYALLILTVLGCDPLTDTYFERLFEMDDISISRVCENNPPLFSDGDFFEIYHISDNTFARFKNKFVGNDTLDIPIGYDYEPISKHENIITWRKIQRGDDKLKFIGKHLYPFGEDVTCFKIEEIKQLLNNEHNYYTCFYSNSRNSIPRFQMFIIDSQEQKLFMIQLKGLT
jgi:hypothetical protein